MKPKLLQVAFMLRVHYVKFDLMSANSTLVCNHSIESSTFYYCCTRVDKMVHNSLPISARDILKKYLGLCQNKSTRARVPAKSISLIPSLFQGWCLLSCPLSLTVDLHLYIVDLIHVFLLEATL